MIFEKIKKYFNKNAKPADKELDEVIDNSSSGFSNAALQCVGNVKLTTALNPQNISNIFLGSPSSIITSKIANATISNVSYSNRIIYNFGPNSQKLFFQIHGETIPRGETFNEFGEYHIIEKPIDKYAARLFHFKVWNKINDQIKDYGLIYVEESGIFLVFNTLESKNSFLEWMNEYKNKFFKDNDVDTTLIPRLPEGQLEGSFIRGLFSENTSSQYLDSWINVVKHCSYPVYKTSDGWFFENSTDAVMCKMIQ